MGSDSRQSLGREGDRVRELGPEPNSAMCLLCGLGQVENPSMSKFFHLQNGDTNSGPSACPFFPSKTAGESLSLKKKNEDLPNSKMNG